MITKQLAIGRAISAIDALKMGVPSVGVHDMRYAIKAEPHVQLFKIMAKDINNVQIASAEHDLDRIEKLLY